MDKISAERRSRNMSQIRSKGMKPEMLVRSIVHGLGYRYRLHRRDLPGKPDLVFGPRKKAIFVHGCFWHGHDDPNCIDGRRKPKSNLEYWLPKLARNRERDHERENELRQRGWEIAIIWECETRDQTRLTSKLEHFLSR